LFTAILMPTKEALSRQKGQRLRAALASSASGQSHADRLHCLQVRDFPDLVPVDDTR
jgi:hypothetical protein